MTNEQTIDSVTWGLQNVGFKLGGYERLGDDTSGWYVSYGDGKLCLHSDNTEGGVPPCALPAGGHLACPNAARDLADQLIRKEALRKGAR